MVFLTKSCKYRELFLSVRLFFLLEKNNLDEQHQQPAKGGNVQKHDDAVNRSR